MASQVARKIKTIDLGQEQVPKRLRVLKALQNPIVVKAERCKRSFYYFLQEFWSEFSVDEFVTNWHIEYLCNELEEIARYVALGLPKKHDLIINIPPGTTKTITCSIVFPVWCWINWEWFRFITASYSGALALESAEYSRDLVKSDKFRKYFPSISIKRDKDTKSNFKIQKTLTDGTVKLGGNRYSTSVGGTLTGFHGHMIIWDDPIDPNRAVSEVELNKANRWIDQTLSTRKVNKSVTPIIGIMQRLHQNDPSGHILNKKKINVKHISLPGEIRHYRKYLKPLELMGFYKDDLLDAKRMDWEVMVDLEADLGQYGYAGQIGQNPVPPGGGMFKVTHLHILPTMPSKPNIFQTIRYWDKAGTQDGGAYTAGCLMTRLTNGKFLVIDMKRGQWATEEREAIIQETAEADKIAGHNPKIYMEQEPGSSGKDSVQSSILNLAGFNVYADSPTGNKIYRADPFSVQVNNGNVLLLKGDWNRDFIEEYRNFPYSTYKDQVDAGSGAFNKLKKKKIAGPVRPSRRR